MPNILHFKDDLISSYELTCSTDIDYHRLRKSCHSLLNYNLPFYNDVRLTKSATASMDQYYDLRNSLTRPKYSDSIYPIAVRYVSSSNHYVVERPPFELTVDFRLGSASSGQDKIYPFKIWVPWTVMVIKLESLSVSDFASVKLFFNDGPIESLEDFVVPIWLPNSYSSGLICFSNSMNDYAHVLDNERILSGDLNYIYNYIFNNYMMGGWNSDLSPHFSYLSTPVVNIHDGEANYPNLYNYNYPSKQTISNIVANIEDPEEAKYIKRALSSKITLNNYRDHVKMYAKHFATLSSFSLEQTLSLVTEYKKYLHKKSKFLSPSTRLKFHVENQTSRYDESSLFTYFHSNVYNRIEANYPYEVYDNKLYMDDFQYVSDSQESRDIIELIGQDNLPYLHSYLINLASNKISNRVVHVTISQDNKLSLELYPEDVNIRSLMNTHKNNISAILETTTLDPNVGNVRYFNTQYSNFSHNEDYFN